MKAKPYMPGSGTEGLDFEGRLCSSCSRGEDGGGCREVYGGAWWGRQPSEWVYVWHPIHTGVEVPWCTAFSPPEGQIEVSHVMVDDETKASGIDVPVVAIIEEDGE